MLDPGLCQKLRTKFADSPNIRVVCCDFLKWPLPRTPYRIFANIPFNRTTEILRRVTQAEHPPEEAWLVVEKGAAKRLLGQPAESTLSLLTKPLFQCDICYSFRREDFHPAPSVDAVLLHLRRKQVPDVLRHRLFSKTGLRPCPPPYQKTDLHGAPPRTSACGSL